MKCTEEMDKVIVQLFLVPHQNNQVKGDFIYEVI
jgi:hypothetical protein